MKRLLFGLFALLLLAAPVVAQTNVNPGVYEASPATLIEGQKTPLLTDINRKLIVINGGSAAGTTQNVVGNAASGATDSGNPVKIGCKYNSTLPTVTDGQRVDVNCGSRGSMNVTLFRQDSSSPLGTASSAGADGATNTSGVLFVRTYPEEFNGTTWDMDFTCPLSAVINVAAAATTQLVALSGSTIIRVCSFAITGDTAATTATFVYGTGANCGTGTTALTGAMRMVDEGNIVMSAGQGSLFRGAAANALCLTAATGAVTGFVTYAQY